ncbi:MAG: PH domain-containing protein [Anaerolineales bacterium]
MNNAYLKSLLGEGEQILFITRRHWTVLAMEILSEVVLALALLVAITVLIVVGAGTLVLAPFAPFFALGYLLLVFPLMSLTRDVMLWRNQMYVITTRRVIQVSGVFNKDVTDSSLEKVNDVKLDQSFMGRMLDYGDVQILTASELGVNRFNKIAEPIRFKTAMLNAKNKLDQPMYAAPPAQAAPTSQSVPALIAQLDGLRQQGLLTDAEFQAKKAQLLAKM